VKSDGFKAAAEAKDFSSVDELFEQDVIFSSPVVFKSYEGREAIAKILSAVVEVFEDFRYVDQLETGDTAVLVFKARIGEREVDGVDILRFDVGEKISELMVMVRPMSGMNALADAMQARLAAAGSG
jgi:hypothetical protein